MKELIESYRKAAAISANEGDIKAAESSHAIADDLQMLAKKGYSYSMVMDRLAVSRDGKKLKFPGKSK